MGTVWRRESTDPSARRRQSCTRSSQSCHTSPATIQFFNSIQLFHSFRTGHYNLLSSCYLYHQNIVRVNIIVWNSYYSWYCLLHYVCPAEINREVIGHQLCSTQIKCSLLSIELLITYLSCLLAWTRATSRSLVLEHRELCSGWNLVESLDPVEFC